jgi:hypothetical protein
MPSQPLQLRLDSKETQDVRTEVIVVNDSPLGSSMSTASLTHREG